MRHIFVLFFTVSSVLLAQLPKPGSNNGGGGGGGSGTVTNVQAGTGITVVDGTTTPTVSADLTILPRFSTGSGTPAAACTAGAEFYTDTAADALYFCDNTDTWQRLQDYNGNIVTASGTLTADLPVIGGGSKAVAVGTRSGNTTQYVTTTGAQTSGDCVKIDANGNHVANGSACGSGGGGGPASVFGGVIDAAAAAASTTAYAHPYRDNFTTSEANRRFISPIACTARNLYFRTTTTQSATGDLVVTLVVNGTASAVTLTVAAGTSASTFSDTTHTATIAAGDYFYLSMANAATANAATVSSWSFACY